MTQSVEQIRFHDQPAVRVTSPDGASAVVMLQGAHVVSWIPAGGEESLYLSEKSPFGPGTAIRGGIPVCFPQYGTRGPLPNHGFARIHEWRVADSREGKDFAAVTLSFNGNEATSTSPWPHAFAIELEVLVSGRKLEVQFRARNPGEAPFSFTFALHSYLRMRDVSKARIEGLQGYRYFDGLKNAEAEEKAVELAIAEEINRIYFAVDRRRRVHEPHRAVEITSENLPDVVVWNPWIKTAAAIADMPDEDYRHMLCVEVAAIEKPVELAPGAEWRGLQRFVAV